MNFLPDSHHNMDCYVFKDTIIYKTVSVSCLNFCVNKLFKCFTSTTDLFPERLTKNEYFLLKRLFVFSLQPGIQLVLIIWYNAMLCTRTKSVGKY